MLRLSLDSMNDKGLMTKRRQSRWHPVQHLTDLDFADDLAMISESIKDAESLLQSLELAASQVGLYCNEGKTEFITLSRTSSELKSMNNSTIKMVEDFQYLGYYIMDSQRDFKIRKALAWDACNKLDSIWQSNIPN